MDPTWWWMVLLWMFGIPGILADIAGSIDEGAGRAAMAGSVAASFGFVLCFFARIWRK
jgi:hypothetical protein